MKSQSPTLLQLGQNIREQRKIRGLSQESLAFNAGLDRTYVGGVERGERNLGILNLCRIAYALKVPPSSLLNGVTHLPEDEDFS
jgi:transcriptional regulator with XRE-family HTH domain